MAGFPITNANYEHSIALLTQRYGQPHKLVQAHMQALLDLPSPNNSLASLQLFHDSTKSHMCSLSSLEKNDSYGMLLVPIIFGKLPKEIKKNLARDHENREWTIDDLQSAILKEIGILELGTCIYTKYEHVYQPAACYSNSIICHNCNISIRHMIVIMKKVPTTIIRVLYIFYFLHPHQAFQAGLTTCIY